MEKDNRKTENSGNQVPQERNEQYLDAAGRSLSKALKVSFTILKLIIVVLVIIFIASGFRTVDSGEKALVLRFGKIRGVGKERLLGPGLHWAFPYPIDKVIKIPVEKKMNLPVDSFWYYQTKAEILSGEKKKVSPGEPLKPIIDGYTLVRGERASDIAETGANDYNIIHTKWELTYKIRKPEAFFENIYVSEPGPAKSYADVMEKSLSPMLQRLLEDSVVTALVNYTIDQVKFEKVASVTRHVRNLLQENLDEINSGIDVVSLQLAQSTWPLQVDMAFQEYIAARQRSQTAESEAGTYARRTQNEAAGPIAQQLFEALHDPDISEQRLDELWFQVAGQAREKIADARAYRTQVVESAKATAEYLHEILPEYRKRPKLVLQRIYLNAIEEVMKNADEKFVVQPSKKLKEHELRILLNRDPSLKPKSTEKGSEQEK